MFFSQEDIRAAQLKVEPVFCGSHEVFQGDAKFLR